MFKYFCSVSLSTPFSPIVSQVNKKFIFLKDGTSILTTLDKVRQIHSYTSDKIRQYMELTNIIVLYESKYYNEYKNTQFYDTVEIARESNFYKVLEMERCNERHKDSFCSYQALCEVRDDMTQKIIGYTRLKKQCESVLAEIAYKL